MKTTNENITLYDKNWISNGISYKCNYHAPIYFHGMNMMGLLSSIFFIPNYRNLCGFKIKSDINTDYHKLNNKSTLICNMIEVYYINKRRISRFCGNRNESISKRGMR